MTMAAFSNSSRILLQKDVEDYLSESFSGNKEHFDKLLKSLTTTPLFTTLRLNQFGQGDNASADTDGILSKLRAELSKQCTSLNWEEFEYFIHPALKDCLVVKNRGPFDIQKYEKEIIVDTSCGMAVLRGANIFKQGIMGAPHGLMKGDKVSIYADLDGRCLKGTSAIYPGNKRHIGNGISQVTRIELFNSKELQTGIGIFMTEPLYQAPSLSELDARNFFPQNLPSIACGHVLNPQPGETILDMCAAPGGKTTHIASLMCGKGRIIALEKSRERVARLKEMLPQMGSNCDIIECYGFDSTKAFVPGQDKDSPPPYPAAMFDRILLDGPCSALGQRPSLANRIGLNLLKSYPVLQRKLLQAAVPLLKPGGVLVYSTCTITVEENEDQVCRVLDTFPEMELEATGFNFTNGGMTEYPCQLSKDDRSKVIRFDPTFTNSDKRYDSWDCDTIGFFIAKFRKKE